MISMELEFAARLWTHGQTKTALAFTIPKRIREPLNIKPGDSILVHIVDDDAKVVARVSSDYKAIIRVYDAKEFDIKPGTKRIKLLGKIGETPPAPSTSPTLPQPQHPATETVLVYKHEEGILFVKDKSKFEREFIGFAKDSELLGEFEIDVNLLNKCDKLSTYAWALWIR